MEWFLQGDIADVCVALVTHILWAHSVSPWDAENPGLIHQPRWYSCKHQTGWPRERMEDASGRVPSPGPASVWGPVLIYLYTDQRWGNKLQVTRTFRARLITKYKPEFSSDRKLPFPSWGIMIICLLDTELIISSTLFSIIWYQCGDYLDSSSSTIGQTGSHSRLVSRTLALRLTSDENASR